MTLSRRNFLQNTGALYVGFQFGSLPLFAQVQAGPGLPNAVRTHPNVDAWLRIGADDRVTLFTGKAELGQGLKTALVQLAAEELDVRPDMCKVVVADTLRTPNESYTAGSRSIQDSGMSIRHAAAEARRILLGMAANRLAVPASTLQVVDGRVSAGTGRSLRYGELVETATLQQPISGAAPLKDRARYTLVGRSLPRVDFPAKVFGGQPAFIQDLRLDGMLHARIVHPPTQRARLRTVDIKPVQTMPGVQHVLHDGSLLGVVATREEQAIAAATALARQAQWENVSTESFPDDAALPQFMREQAVRSSSVARRGEPGNTPRPHRATYFRPFQAHASIGPSCALALFQNGQLTVWSHTQGIYPLRVELARVLGLAENAIRTISEESAGCYGQNGADDAAVEAAILAMALPGKPIRLQWSRADEFGWEPLGAAMLMDCEAALDERGRISDWRSVVRGFPNTARPGFGGGNGANLLAAQLREKSMPPRDASNVGLNRNSEPLYDIPVVQVAEELIPVSPVRVSSLRTLGAYANVFAIESFMDELANAAGADPLAFRLAHLTDPRGRAVLEAAARAANWQTRSRLASGHGLGIGYARYSSNSTYCAVVAEVSVDNNGAPHVRRIWAAADCGPIVNPDGVRNQIAGGAMQATSWTLLESVRLRHAGQGVTNWHEYPILRFADAPMIDVVLIDRPDQPLVGPGEASLGPTSAAIANAVFAACGARVRSVPLTPQKVRALTP
jgi:CO/xanthine dehydrogenase Mo-binding subunit